MATLEDILSELKKINKTVGDNEDATKEVNKELETSVDLLKERNEEYEKVYTALEKELETYQKIQEEIKTASGLRKKALKEQLNASKENLKTLKAQTKEGQKRNKQLENTLKVMKGIQKTVGAITKLNLASAFDVTAIIEATHKLDGLQKSLLKTGAVGKQFESRIVETQRRLRDFSLTGDDATKALGTLINSTSQFTNASKANQDAITDTVAALEKGFRAGAEGAQVYEQLATVFGQTEEQASGMVKNLSETGGAMQIPVKQMLSAFQQAAPRLALYGDGMEREFLKLQATSKATGVSINSLLQISQGFDTFEDAARKTSQLNAMFGTQLNSVDLLNMKDEERIRVIREQLALQGKSVETLGKFELLSLSRIIGVDAATLKAGFKDVGDEVDNLIARGEAEDKRDFGKQVQDALTAQEKFEGAMDRLSKIVIQPLTKLLNGLADLLQSDTFKSVETLFTDLSKNGIEAIKKFSKFVGADPMLVGATAIATGIAATAIAGFKLSKFVSGKILEKSVKGILNLSGIDVSSLTRGTPTTTTGGGGGAGPTPLKSAKNIRGTPAGKIKRPMPDLSKMNKGHPALEKLFKRFRIPRSLPGGPRAKLMALVAAMAAGGLYAAHEEGLFGEEFGGYKGEQRAVDTTGIPGYGPIADIGVPKSIARPAPEVPPMLARAPTTPTVPTTTTKTTTSKEDVSTMATQIATEVAKSFNPVINMTAYVGDKQTTVRLVKDALNSSYPLGRATSGG